MTKKNNTFNVGFYGFHEDEGFNFQLNRFYTYGVFSKDELMTIGRQIDGFEKWISLFRELGEEAEKRKEPLKAATCYRAAQFYTLSGERDADGNSLKHLLYDKCIELYNDYFFSSYQNLKLERISFDGCELPVYYATCENPRGTIVIHGGYDSISQEFLVMLPYFKDKYYNVYFFEGPGQGEVLMHHDVRMTPEWEHCTGAGDLYTVYYQDQLDALVNAKSVTGRLFTKEEHADHHCQVGNMGLALDTIAGWIEEKTNGEKSSSDRR